MLGGGQEIYQPSCFKDVLAIRAEGCECKDKRAKRRIFSPLWLVRPILAKQGSFAAVVMFLSQIDVFSGTVFIRLLVSLLSCTSSVQNISSSDNLLLFSWQPAPLGFGASRGCQKDVGAPAHSDFSFSSWVSIILSKDFPLQQAWEEELVTSSSRVENLAAIWSFKRRAQCQPKGLWWQDIPLWILRLPLK